MQRKHALFVALLAAALLIAGAVYAPPVGGLLLFVAAFTAIIMWMQGFTRTPKFVQERRTAVANSRSIATPHNNVPERVYRMRINRWAIAMCYVIGIVPLALGVLTLAAAVDHPNEHPTLVVLGAAMTAFGVFFTYYAWRVGRMAVRVSPHGIQGDLLFGSCEIAWDDVVAVARKTLTMYTQPVIVDHAVYSRDGAITIAAKLENREELLDIVMVNSPQLAKESV